MKKYHNMTGEDIQSNEELFKEGRSVALDVWDLLLTLIFLVSFFGSIYLYFQNRTLAHELEQKHLLIMDLQELYKKK